MVVKLIDDKVLWDKQVDESPYGTVFHTWDFLRIIEKNSGSTLYPYGVLRGDELICIFPLFVKHFMGVRMVFSPPPGMAIPYLGFVMGPAYDRLKQRRKESYINSVADEIEEEIKKLHVNFAYISTVNGFTDVRPFKWNGYDVQMNYSYAIDLRRTLADIREGFDDELKRAVAESEGSSLAIRPAGDVDQFYGILKSRFKSHHETPPIVSKEYLRDVLEAFPDNFNLSFLYHGDDILEPVASYRYKKRAGIWVWSARQDDAFHGSEFTAWHWIKKMKAEGMEALEMPGADLRSQFAIKSRFNAPLVYNYSIFKNDLKGRMGKGVYASAMKIRV